MENKIKKILDEFSDSTIRCKGFVERNGRYMACLSRTNVADNISREILPIFNEEPFNCSRKTFRDLIYKAINEHNRSLNK